MRPTPASSSNPDQHASRRSKLPLPAWPLVGLLSLLTALPATATNTAGAPPANAATTAAQAAAAPAMVPAAVPSAVPATAARTIAMLPFELIDETLDAGTDAAQQARLGMITELLRTQFAKQHLYAVLANAPAAALITDLQSRFDLHDCNGCDVDIGRALHADRVMTAWVQKVSNLILNINIQIRDVRSGLIMLNKSVDIRGNTDESWRRGILYMVRSMVEKNQANR
jgi:hypothetical protein